MPYVRSQRRKGYRKPRAAKRRYTRSYKSKMLATRGKTPLGRSLWPDTFFAKLRYNAVYNITSGTSNYISFRGNSIYDPETAVGGGQPVGADQLFAIWNHCYVRSSSCTARIIPGSAAIGAGLQQVTLYPTLAGSLITSSDAAGQPYAKNKIMTTNASKQVVLSSFMPLSKIMGIKTKGERDYNCTVAANPTAEYWWHINVGSLDGVTPMNVYVVVDMVYYCKFFTKVRNVDV